MDIYQMIGLRPFDPSIDKPVSLPGGSFATEYTTTSQDPYTGEWVVHPQIWWDEKGKPVYVPGEQGLRVVQALEAMGANPFPRFKDLAEADKFSVSRSQMGGGTRGGLLEGY